MDTLQCDGDENTGDQTRDVTRYEQRSLRRRAGGSIVAARRLGMELGPEGAGPGCKAPATKDAETGTGGEIGAHSRGAQLLVAVRRVRDGQPGSICFFLRASAR